MTYDEFVSVTALKEKRLLVFKEPFRSKTNPKSKLNGAMIFVGTIDRYKPTSVILSYEESTPGYSMTKFATFFYEAIEAVY